MLRNLRSMDKSNFYGHFKRIRVSLKKSSTSNFYLICLKLTELIGLQHYIFYFDSTKIEPDSKKPCCNSKDEIEYVTVPGKCTIKSVIYETSKS